MLVSMIANIKVGALKNKTKENNHQKTSIVNEKSFTWKTQVVKYEDQIFFGRKERGRQQNLT